MNYPGSLDNGVSLPNPNTSNNTNNPSHAGLHTSENAAIIALEGKVGTGATVPAANTLLVGTGAGTSAWQGLTSAQLAAVLSDETGSGSAVFANTPVLITPKVDTINENTPGNGVTVGGVNLKSGVITTPGAVGTTALASGIQVPDKMKNPYKFSVYRNAAQTSSSGSTVVLQFDTKLYDTGSNVDVVTNKGRFTAPVAGFYKFSGRTSCSGARIIISLSKNSVETLRGGDTPSASPAGVVVAGTLQLAANDFVEVTCFTSAAVAFDVGAAISHFQGELVSAT